MQFHYSEETQSAFQEKRESSFVESVISPAITQHLSPSQKSHPISVESKVSVLSQSQFHTKVKMNFIENHYKIPFLIMIPGYILRKLDSILYYNATFLKKFIRNEQIL